MHCCSRLLLQSVPSADPWGKPPTRLKGPDYTCVHSHIRQGSDKVQECDLLHPHNRKSHGKQRGATNTSVRCRAQTANLTKKKLGSSSQNHLLITYILRATVLREKLIIPQLVKKFPAFYETRRFITAFTRARHLSLS